MDQFLEILKAGGPSTIAALIGLALFVIWGKLNTIRIFYEGDPENPEKTPGRLREERVAAQQREDAIRTDYDQRLTDQRKHYEALLQSLRLEKEAELKTEREENKSLFRELNETFKSLRDE